MDARTGAPLAQVAVIVEDTDKYALTDAEGRFQIAGLAPGTHHIRVAVIGYALFRQEVTVSAESSADPAGGLTIRLSEGTTAYSDVVVEVLASPFRTPPDPVPSASVLGSAELLNLRGVLADDPLRAVQVLPGVATGDDLRSEFTVRGSDFKHLTFTVDGFSTPYLLHTVRGVEDRGTTGSVAMINSDVLEDVTLLNGAYPQRFGGHTGAEVDFRTREGSNAGWTLRASVSGTSASAVAEGEIGRSGHGQSGRGSWLVSGRQSYIDHLVRHLTERSVSFGFADAQGRLAYDLTKNQHVDLTVIAGHSRFLNEPGDHDLDYVYDATNAATVAVAGWRLKRTGLTLTQRILAAGNQFRNENESGVELDRGKDRQLAYRADAAVKEHDAISFDAGFQAERRDDSRIRRRLAPNRAALVELDNYTADGLAIGGHAALRWRMPRSITIAPGVRADHWTLTDQTTVSPWIQGEWSTPRGLSFRAAAGRYQQFPDFEHVMGASGGAGLVPEDAVHYDVGVERRFSRTLRASLTLYDREEEDMLRRPGGETRIVNGRPVRGSAAAKYENRLDGFARGVEVMVQRTIESAGVSGWFSYSYGRNRYRDVVNGETFWGDYDQRHTLNAYGLYRHSDRLNFVAKLRVGSNFPIPGYYAQSGGAYFLTDVRNTERLPVYARLDLRANRAFAVKRRQLTLFAEVINVLNRANYRFEPPGVNLSTRVVTTPLDSLLPIVPSVGFLIEF